MGPGSDRSETRSLFTHTSQKKKSTRPVHVQAECNSRVQPYYPRMSHGNGESLSIPLTQMEDAKRVGICRLRTIHTYIATLVKLWYILSS